MTDLDLFQNAWSHHSKEVRLNGIRHSNSKISYLVRMLKFWTLLEEHGQLHVAKGRYQDHLVAVKCPHDELWNDFPHVVDCLRREVSIMAQLRHPNLVHFIGAVINNHTENTQSLQYQSYWTLIYEEHIAKINHSVNKTCIQFSKMLLMVYIFCTVVSPSYTGISVHQMSNGN